MPSRERDAAASQPRALHAEPLVDAALWRVTEPQDDPFADHRPDEIDCGIAGFFPEFDALEIDTGRCNYLEIEQPALHAVAAGDPIELELLHFDLTASEPAQAHVALSFGDALQWETNVDIPQPAGSLSPSLHATRALELGQPIRFHLHNHGQNTWLLVALSVKVP